MEAGAELIARMGLISGEQHVLTGATVLSTFRSDGIRRSGPLPFVAVLPGSPSEVVNIVAACADARTPYTVRGAGTSTSGGALPRTDAVHIVLTRMRRIIASTGSELTVEAGVPLVALPRPAGGTWLEAPEPLLGTVGGHVAQTTGVSNICALDLVRTDGTLVRLDSRRPGYDLAGAFPGSQGRAGIALTITLRAVTTGVSEAVVP